MAQFKQMDSILFDMMSNIQKGVPFNNVLKGNF